MKQSIKVWTKSIFVKATWFYLVYWFTFEYFTWIIFEYFISYYS